MKPLGQLALILLVFISGPALAETLVIEGGTDSSIEVLQERTFIVPAGGLSSLSFRYANPADSGSGPVGQSVSNRRVEYSPRPEKVFTEKDAFGNTFTTVYWKSLEKDVSVRESYRVDLRITLKGIRSSALFPVRRESIPNEVRVYLKPTPRVQSEDGRIRALSKRLTKGMGTEQAAVTSILNWVVDNVKYRTPIPRYDALWTLERKEGNCQNFSHTAMAILRSAGIPARIAGGVSLGRAWKVPLKEGALLQSIGQGGHAWIEVWYQDLGWVPYDVQQSHLFVGPRHIKQAVGLDSEDINDSWKASPELPPFREDISADYPRDVIALRLKETKEGPSSYIMAGSFAGAAPSYEKPPVVITPQATEPLPGPVVTVPGPTESAKKAPEIVEFGNMDFPALMDFYVGLKGVEGRKTFDKETAEYVTGGTAYAQAFTVERAMRLEGVSLAMHKFGGRIGSLWIDLVSEGSGKPGAEGFRSLPLNLDSVPYYPGYKWFDFRFSRGLEDAPILSPGKYWIILRHSKDAVVSWFYTPGNPYGPSGDTRSTSTGIDWSDILNYDFNFKVTGEYVD